MIIQFIPCSRVFQFSLMGIFTALTGAIITGGSLAAESPLSPGQARAAFQTEPGLRVELAAAEPVVGDPVALAFDERGRLFVAENRGYPLGSPDGKPLGVIAMLEDTDGDGQFEKRTEFASGLTFPNGVLPWRGGVIVTCAPDLLWLADTNGDGRADVREVWLTGFDDKNTTQLRVSHPTLGPDGWIYLTSGWTGENTVRSPKFPNTPPVKLRTDSRFHPFTGEFEAIDGRSQFGQTFDDFGNRFICYNRVHVQHVVMSSRHLRRNPDFAFADTVQNCPEDLIHDLLGNTENRAARLYPISENVTTADSHGGTFTAACGVHVYRGDALPGFYGRIFACDPTGNLVHWDDLVPQGATFIARRSTHRTEFLASTDNWFRPVNLATGPDGALYICDMYRKTIEHPQYLPEEVRKRTDFDSGRGMGRIWRVTARNSSKFKIQHSKLADADNVQLVTQLSAPNGWQRDAAFRLLIERQATNALESLLNLLPVLPTADAASLAHRRAASDPPAPGPHLARINAINAVFALSGGRRSDARDKAEIERFAKATRDTLGTTDEWLRQFYMRWFFATFDESPGVRDAAFRWIDAMPSEGPDIGGEFHLAWADDPNSHVRFRAALFLGKCEYGDIFRALARIARQDGADRWLRAAVFSGLKERENYFFETLWRETNAVPAPEFLRELFRLRVHPQEALIALTDPNECQRLFGTRPMRGDADSSWQIAGLAGLVEGLRARNPAAAEKLSDLADKTFGNPPTWKVDGRHLRALLDQAATLVNDAGQPLVVRSACVALLAHERGSEAAPGLISLLSPGQPSELQTAAAQALVSFPDDTASRALLAPDRWRNLSPSVRMAVLGALLGQPRHAAALLEAVEAGRISPTTISAAQRNQLLKHKDTAVKTLAEKLFKSAGGDRMKVFEEFKPVLGLKADPARGRAMFGTHCASCHRLDRVGFAVGPDLLGMRNQSKETILLHTLVPEHEIMPGFANYTIETKDGRTLNGLIASESDTSVTLRRALGEQDTVLRKDIASISVSHLSLMPQEMEKTMSRQELADLLGYLKGEGPPGQ